MIHSNKHILPREIILEVTNACNLRCRQCHFHGQGAVTHRPTGHMKKRSWEKVLAELHEWGQPVTLLTHGAGEPLLYPGLMDLLHAAKKNPNISTGFMTNGMLLDGDWASTLVELQVDWVAFSIDGINPETHDHFRKGADLRHIERNVNRLIQEKKLKNSRFPLLSFNMVGYPEIIDQSIPYVMRWLPHAERVTISKCRPVGSLKLWDTDTKITFQPCPLLYRQMVIAWDGRVGLCCEDIHIDIPLGNIDNTSMSDLYNTSQKLLTYRNQHEKGYIDKLPLCSACHVWGGDRVVDREELIMGGLLVERVRTPAFDDFHQVAIA